MRSFFLFALLIGHPFFCAAETISFQSSSIQINASEEDAKRTIEAERDWKAKRKYDRLIRSENVEEILKVIEAALEKNPKDWIALTERAMVHLERYSPSDAYDFKEQVAENDLREAQSLAPAYYRIYYGFALLLKDDDPENLPILKTGLRLNPKFAPFHFCRAKVLIATGRPFSEIDHELLLAEETDNLVDLMRIVDTRVELGRIANKEDHLRRAARILASVKESETSLDYWCSKLDFLALKEDWKGYEDSLAIATKFNPKDPFAHLRKITLAVHKKNYRECIRLAEENLNLKGDPFYANERKAFCHIQLSEYPQAYEAIKKAIRYGVDEDSALFYAHAAEALGKRAEVKKWMRKLELPEDLRAKIECNYGLAFPDSLTQLSTLYKACDLAIKTSAPAHRGEVLTSLAHVAQTKGDKSKAAQYAKSALESGEFLLSSAAIHYIADYFGEADGKQNLKRLLSEWKAKSSFKDVMSLEQARYFVKVENNPNAAEKFLNEVNPQTLEPYSYRIYSNVKKAIAQAKGKPEDALAIAKEGFQRSPDSITLADYALLVKQQRSAKEALDIVESNRSKIGSPTSDLLMIWAGILSDLKRDPEAHKMLLDAEARAPNDPRLLFNIAQSFATYKKDCRSAKKYADRSWANTEYNSDVAVSLRNLQVVCGFNLQK